MRAVVATSLVASALGQFLVMKAPMPLASPNVSEASNCSVYKKSSDNCDSCGACKNGGARPGVLCKGKNTGYYCPPEAAPDQDMAFACMDWTFGSQSMKTAEGAFNTRTGDNVKFGVGTYGSTEDVQRGLGSCFRLQVEGMETELILQSLNTGSDVAGTQFDMQVGDGGAGAFNTCAGGKQPGVDSMYPGTYDKSNWGKQYGGVDHKADCANLPSLPSVSGAMKSAGDDLVKLCEYSFDQGARGEGGSNPSILSIGRVQCPDELVAMTQLRRNDDPSSYKCGTDCIKASSECGLHHGNTAEWCLTRMMDCRKPSGAVIDNTKAELMVAGHRLAQPCTSDGYTRIDVQCGCADCYC